MIKNIHIPLYVYKGITHNHKEFPQKWTLFGGDTETYDGNPVCFQVSNGKWTDLIPVNKDNILDKFLMYMEKRIYSGCVNAIYFHNLIFDISVIFNKFQKEFIGKNEINISYKGININIVYGKVCFGNIKYPENKTLKILDSYAFFLNYSLEKLCNELETKHKKLKKPDGLGKKNLIDNEYFINYAKQDALCQYEVAEKIFEQYRKYNVRICVSLPHFASRIFRHYFLRENDIIKFPCTALAYASVKSYHGGKNGLYVKGTTIIDNCYEYDIKSAYPFAMTKIPNFLKGKYKFFNNYTDKYEGIYCVSGKINNCKYPVLFSHDFKPITGKFENIWVTSYELKSALKYKEVELSNIYGWLWIPEKTDYNPFKEFVYHFYKEKEIAKNSCDRLTAKLIMNSLYGKLVQTIDKSDNFKDILPNFSIKGNVFVENSKNIFLAGRMFNPFIATLITGFVRAYIHKYEHKYSSIHTSTDSIKTIVKPDYNDLGNELGKLNIVVKGKCYIFRNKLYLHYDDNNNLKKYALHGFMGNSEQLLKMYNDKKYEYNVTHIFKIKEGLRQNKIPAKMYELKKTLKGVDFTNVNII
ncbi:MAG: DNA polymerase [Candidatus Omnitrophica bacterium]|nr:DNA polymerase [Candidatus Omnitrophota bacterium]